MEEAWAVVLAAGLGTRMRSERAKVLHPVGGQPMLQKVQAVLRDAGFHRQVVVVGHQAEEVARVAGEVPGVILRVARQAEPLGTAHAVLQAMAALDGVVSGTVLVAYGDTPLLRAGTVRRLHEAHRPGETLCTLLTAEAADPTGYGRIVRDPAGGRFVRVVEEKDADPETRRVREINAGLYLFDLAALRRVLPEVEAANRQGEYYLPDAVARLAREGGVETVRLEDAEEIQGINDRVQLARAEKVLRRRILEHWMVQGVTVIDPDTTFVDEEVELGQDTVLLPFTFLEGRTRVGARCRLGPNARLVDSRLGDDVEVQMSVLLEADVGEACRIGPFAYLRPGARLAARVKVGDFVEVKNSTIGAGTKVPHLSYVGDATLGAGVNVGAGTITCNYDGRQKHRTVVGDDAFIGSNSSLVAPVTVGEGAYVAAGSVITRRVPAEALAIGRGRQRNVERWAGRRRSNDGERGAGER
ncbi:bifunctional UDP-N-acetylglucosamine diphosphorylase/glucosamine-1-phosphate N-acetyltransferase GlmU [Limnochorda pilosa]|uniref:Bifunctional protein GlmU n=1 Tax=Limnochorda pilosa TaxID=1555112 RepID=A0A0K2SQJ8_LIMPI|nr:bifunctional UDP-N-acetylglucosamine diphosphorylase/glucosamine-1-phosphate N-acetyltransferase GlmU [Limnochorda pilosa]BAS29408.1 N-acetylglucosamine-1-phosphate uridyltransferase [Limnochorda pilosa]